MSDPKKTQQTSFKNALRIIEWLHENGYQVCQAKVYKDVKAGLLKKRNGVFTQSAVKDYAAGLPKSETGITKGVEKTIGLHEEKTKKEISLKDIRIQREKLELQKLEGRILPREDFDRELAARFLVLKSDLNFLAKAKAGQMIHLVHGDIERTNELTEFLLDAINSMLDNYASTKKFHIMILPEVI